MKQSPGRQTIGAAERLCHILWKFLGKDYGIRSEAGNCIRAFIDIGNR